MELEEIVDGRCVSERRVKLCYFGLMGEMESQEIGRKFTFVGKGLVCVDLGKSRVSERKRFAA